MKQVLRRPHLLWSILFAALAASNAPGQQPAAATANAAPAALSATVPAARTRAPENPALQQTAVVDNEIEQALWFLRAGDVADIDFLAIASTKPIRTANATGQGAGNPLIIYFYTFTPKTLAAGQKAPLILLNHGGVRSHFDLTYLHIVRELVQRGYIVAAPEYRGSTGYGEQYYEQIDYGGAEIDDVHDVRNWAVANLQHVDASRVGIMGWSHGGYVTLLNIFRWPHDYKVAYAGCPVSDLVMRMGYKSQEYRDIFAGFLGKQAQDNPMEYRRRSPVFHAAELDTPLLLHTNTNDEDVNVMEVEHLIDSLKANGKNFEYKIYENAPGGHHFNRIDTALARQSREEIYSFLGKYLKP